VRQVFTSSSNKKSSQTTEENCVNQGLTVAGMPSYGERETVPHRILLAHTALVRLFEVNRRRTDPEQPERGIADLVEQGDVLDGGVVKTAPNADTSLARTTKNFPCKSFSCTRRVSYTQAGSKPVVLCGRERTRHSGIPRKNKAGR